MRAHFVTADVFTQRRFGGNQLAVFPDAREIAPELFPAIAREFNLSETTFVLPPSVKRHAAKVRIFAPAAELPFAGHPTIGTAYVLASIGAIPLTGDETQIVLEEVAGPVPVTIHARDGEPHLVQLTAPLLPQIAGAAPTRDSLAKMLSLNDEDIMSAVVVSSGTPFLLIQLRGKAAVVRAQLNINIYESLLADYLSEKVFIFSLEGQGRSRKAHARMFAPAIGIPEDAGTGSAAAALGGYLALLDPLKEGRLRWTISQGVEMGRPSLLEVEACKERGIVIGVLVGGRSVVVCEGTITL